MLRFKVKFTIETDYEVEVEMPDNIRQEEEPMEQFEVQTFRHHYGLRPVHTSKTIRSIEEIK